jgi:hypothetical protein
MWFHLSIFLRKKPIRRKYFFRLRRAVKPKYRTAPGGNLITAPRLELRNTGGYPSYIFCFHFLSSDEAEESVHPDLCLAPQSPGSFTGHGELLFWKTKRPRNFEPWTK